MALFLLFARTFLLTFAENYPKHIPDVDVRLDYYTQQPVTRGHAMKLIFGQRDSTTITTESFEKLMQCSGNEPEIFDDGPIKMLKLAKLDKVSAERVLAWAESGCHPWALCGEWAKSIKVESQLHGCSSQLSCSEAKNVVCSPHMARLVRVKNGQLYTDWPWCSKRFKLPPLLSDAIVFLLSKISNIGDSVFLIGEEVSYLPWDIPFPAFSYSPSFKSGEIPWPWFQPYLKELYHHTQIHEAMKNMTAAELDSFASNPDHFDAKYQVVACSECVPWEERIPKAIFYGSLTRIRQVLMDQAVIRPDLFDVKWTGGSGIEAWNPLSNEPPLPPPTATSDAADESAVDPAIRSQDESDSPVDAALGHAGFLAPLLNLRAPGPSQQPSGRYKYVIVLEGRDGHASADRLAPLLANSGAVVLLQTSEFRYHFSSRLRPWVHYVPLAHSAADATEKIEWLEQHPHLARKIAINAHNFGVSHLRLEDTFCYVLSALKAVSAVLNGSDLLTPWNPVMVWHTLFDFNEG